MSIYLKLLEMQNNLSCPKNEYNDYGKFSYRSIDGIMKSLRPMLDAEGCALFFNSELVMIGNRNYVKSTAILVDVDTGEKITSDAFAREDEVKKGMDGAQITAAATTYSRKIALCGMFNIDNEKREWRPAEQSEALQKLKDYIFINRINDRIICEYYGVRSIGDLTDEQCRDYIRKSEEYSY